MTGSPEEIAPPIVGTGSCGSAVSTERRRAGRPGGRRARPAAGRSGVQRVSGSGHAEALRQCPPCSSRPARLRRPEPPPITNTRTAGSRSTPLSTPRTQRSNQRRRNSKKSSARLPSTAAAGAELDLAGVAQRAVAMRPRPEDQLHRAALRPRQAGIVLHRGARIGVVPARQMHHRHVGIGVVKAFGIDAGLLPVIVEIAVRPLLEQILLVFGRGADRRVPRATACGGTRRRCPAPPAPPASPGRGHRRARCDKPRSPASGRRRRRAGCRCDRRSRSRRNRGTARPGRAGRGSRAPSGCAPRRTGRTSRRGRCTRAAAPARRACQPVLGLA